MTEEIEIKETAEIKAEKESFAEPKIEQILQFLTAEHRALQSARATAAAEVNSRLNVFLFAIVGGILALAFIGQISGTTVPLVAATPNSAQTATQSVQPIPGMIQTAPTPAPAAQTSSQPASPAGQGFFWFGLILFPALFFLGLTVFVRALQTGMEDAIYQRGIARIRNFYVRIQPEAADYFVNPFYEDSLSLLKNVTITRSRLQAFATAAGTVAVVNSILAGAWLAILLQFAFAPPVWLAAVLGAFLFLVALAAHRFYELRRREDFEAHLDPPKFPAPVDYSR